MGLEELYLSGNHIAVISSHAFQLLSTLVILNLARNNIREINDEGFAGLLRVEEMHLEDNKLVTVPTSALSESVNLKKLFLGKNLFQEISGNALLKNINLDMINISHCQQLMEIKASAFKSNILLKTIMISDNHNLKNIDQNAFNQNMQVENIDFTRNELCSLSEKLLKWKSVKTFQLSGNLWHCDCELKWLQETIIKVVNDTKASVRIIKCFSPNDLWDHYIVTVYIPDCEMAPTSKQSQSRVDHIPYELNESFIVHIVTVIFATLVLTVVVFGAMMCMVIKWKKKAEENSLSNHSENSRGTDISYYQVGSNDYISAVKRTNSLHILPSQYFIRPSVDNEVLWKDDLSELTL